MNILAIDLGSYSVKFIESTSDRKKIVHHAASSVLLSDVQHQFSTETPLFQKQLSILKDYWTGLKKETLTIAPVPAQHLTHRFLTLPTKNRRKAEMMIPFQLDEDLPYSLAEAHFSATLLPQKETSYAMISIIAREQFRVFHQAMQEQEVLPTFLTNEAWAYFSYASRHPSHENFAILDLGHETTKFYFFQNSQLSATHLSYTAGKKLTESIAQTYNLSHAEAQAYKHKNAFLLTQQQLSQVTSDQQDFAKLMESVLMPLIKEFKTWELGFRLNASSGLSHLYLTGGTARTRGIEAFLSHHLGLETSLLDTFNEPQLKKEARSIQEDGSQANYNQANLIAIGLLQKNLRANFNTGEFAGSQESHIPVHSSSFLGVRILLITMLLLFSMICEKYFLKYRVDELNTQAVRILKNPALNLSAKKRRSFSLSPPTIYTQISKTEKQQKQQQESTQTLVSTNALAPLSQLSSSLSLNDLGNIIKYKGKSNNTFVLFQVSDRNKIDELKQRIKILDLTDLIFESQKDPRQLSIQFKNAGEL